MPPADRRRHHVSAWRRSLPLAAALAVGIVTGAVALPLVASASAVASTSYAAGSSLTLAGQTSWVRGPSGLELQLRIESSLPVSALGLKFILYSRLTSRSAFAQSLSGTEPATELPVETPPTIPLSALDHRGSASGAVTIRFPVVTAPSTPSRSLSSPKLDLACGSQCDGVYPLEAALVDSGTGDLLATLTTHLIYTAGTAGSLPLDVSLVLPSGTTPALGSAGGVTALSTARLLALQKVLTTIAAQPHDAVTLDLYPQLLVALERGRTKLAEQVLAMLDSLAARQGADQASAAVQVLGTTFTPVEVSALSSAGLGGELKLQLARGIQALDTGLGRSLEATPYVSATPLDRSSLSLLEKDSVRQIVLPATDVAPIPGTPQPTVALTSPFVLLPPPNNSAGSPGQAQANAGSTSDAGAAGSTGGTVGLVADAGLAAHFGADPGDPELAAHQLLADLAEIYFDAPSDQAPRGVVVAPAEWSPDASFLSGVLAGLSDSPILQTLPLGQAFQLPIGGNGSPRDEELVADGQVPQDGQQTLTASPVVTARHSLGVVESVLPTDKVLLARLGDAILLGESAGLSSRAVSSYVTAPQDEVKQLSRSLSITGGRTVTLTSRTGQIPITISSNAQTPIHALLELRDSSLTFHGAGTRPQLVTFGTRTTSLDYKVSTLTSGSSSLDVVVVSPDGGVPLLDSKLTIQSTAVSGVAVALSIGALVVLAAWWLRSVLRHRRRAAQAREAALGAGGEPPAIA